MRRWRNGDDVASRRLLSRYRRELVAYFRRRAPGEAEDLAQAVLLACIEARDRIRDDEAFRYYAYGVAWRMLVRSSRRSEREPSSLEDEVEAEGDDPELLLQRSRWRARLLGHVAELSLPNRRAVELYYFDELKSREVAEALSIPHATARSRLVRGVESLRRALEPAVVEGQSAAHSHSS